MTYWRAFFFFFSKSALNFSPLQISSTKRRGFKAKGTVNAPKFQVLWRHSFGSNLISKSFNSKWQHPKNEPHEHMQVKTQPRPQLTVNPPTQLNQIRSKTKAAAAKKNLDLPRQFSICSLFTMLANLLKNLYSLLWPILWRNHLLRPRSRRRQDYRWGLGRDRPRNRHHCHRQSQHEEEIDDNNNNNINNMAEEMTL